MLSFKNLIKNYTKDDVKFTRHARIKLKQMPFDQKFVVKRLFDVKKLIYEEFQKNRKTYKLIYKHSGRYSMVIVVSLTPKFIKIVTVYKTSKKLQKLIKRRGVIHIIKVFKMNNT